MMCNKDEAKKPRKVVTQYHSTLDVSPISNVCERLFNKAKLIIDEIDVLWINKDH